MRARRHQEGPGVTGPLRYDITMDTKTTSGHEAAAEKDLERFMVQLDKKAAKALRKIMEHLGTATRPQAIRWALTRAARNLRT